MNLSQVQKKSDHPVATALTLIFFACLVFAPVLIQHEPLRWQAAQAMLQYDAGNRDDAIKSLQQIALKTPDDGYVQTRLVYWLSENGQAEKAIKHCEQQLVRNPDSQDWLELRRHAECEAGDFKAAWQTFQELKTIRTQRVSRTSDELNEQAYFRALADEDLKTAAAEIQTAVSTATSRSAGADFLVPLPSQALIAAGLLSRRTGSQSVVLPQLNRRIEIAERALEDRENSVGASLAQYSVKSFPPSEQQESSLDEMRSSIEFRRRELAFLMVCRALMFEDLDQPERCDLDRAQVVELGFEPQLVADLLPDDSVCNALAMRAVAYLDTRGLVLTKMPWSEPDDLIDGVSTIKDAIADASIAVTVSEVIDHFVRTSSDFSTDEQNRFRKTFAAVLHHRVMANRKAGNSDAVNSDRQRIESLGYDPDGNLY